MRTFRLSGAQIVAARTLVGVSRARLSSRSKVEIDVIERIEAAGLALLPETDVLRRLATTLEDIGAMFIDESEGRGFGVRLKFSRGMTGAIGEWEAEGGLPAEDDIP